MLPAAAGATGWLAVTAALALSGVLARFDARPPTILTLVILVVGAALVLAFSVAGERLARELPLAWLVGIQGLPLPLELVMHRAASGSTPGWRIFRTHGCPPVRRPLPSPAT